MSVKFNLATKHDASNIKDLINEMYGIEYEVRDIEKIKEAIENKTEIYILVYENNGCVGFSGASVNNSYYSDIISSDVAVIDYIYVKENKRNISISFKLISLLMKQLINLNINKAIMQVQTFNKQRFFHYALSDKNIIKSVHVQKDEKEYEDQILLIDDLEKTSNISIKELMLKAYQFSKDEKYANN